MSLLESGEQRYTKAINMHATLWLFKVHFLTESCCWHEGRQAVNILHNKLVPHWEMLLILWPTCEMNDSFCCWSSSIFFSFSCRDSSRLRFHLSCSLASLKCTVMKLLLFHIAEQAGMLCVTVAEKLVYFALEEWISLYVCLGQSVDKKQIVIDCSHTTLTSGRSENK